MLLPDQIWILESQIRRALRHYPNSSPLIGNPEALNSHLEYER
jgi:hypothetical protein